LAARTDEGLIADSMAASVVEPLQIVEVEQCDDDVAAGVSEVTAQGVRQRVNAERHTHVERDDRWC
jgi:hypothetical protein